jgi:hypothetical protein
MDRQVELEIQKRFSDDLPNHHILSTELPASYYDNDVMHKLTIDDESIIYEGKTITDDSISFINDIRTVQELQDEESKYF